MKQTMKKVVSLLLSVLMIVSVCTVAIATEAEEVPTFKDFGVYDGTGIYYSGMNRDSIVEFEGEYVIQMFRGHSSGSGNYNLRLADPENPDQPYTMVNGMTYTVMFDYYINAPVSFQTRPMKDPTATDQRGDAYQNALTGYSADFAGDGKWHTASFTFTYTTVTGGGVTLDNIGLLHQCSTDVLIPGYLKNIRILANKFSVAGSNITMKVVPDPVVENETALELISSTVRNNFLLANGKNEDGAFIPFDPTAGTYYTVKFDYFYEAGTKSPDFRLYYGTSSPSKQGKRAITVEAYSASSDESLAAAIGDGKWHTGAMTFKAADTTLTDGTTAAPYVYLTYMGNNSDNDAIGYIKNIEVIEETGAVESYGSKNFNMAVQEDIIGKNTYGSQMTKSYINEETGNMVLVCNGGNNPSVNNATYVQGRCIMSNSTTAFAIYPGVTYTITMDYKVVGDTASTEIGLGYQKSGTATTNYETHIIALDTYSAGVTTDWKTLKTTFVPTLNSGVDKGYIKVILYSNGAAVEIGNINITYTGLTNAPFISYNDNGNIDTDVAYVGTTIEKVGNNSDNAAMGESFMGWYTTPDFATGAEVTTYPATATTLYARYPSVIIDDFSMLSAYTSGTHYKSAAGYKLDLAAGTLTFAGNHGNGFLLPGYDANVLSPYKFKNNVKYRFAIYYNSITTSGSAATATPNLYYGDGYGGTTSRPSSMHNFDAINLPADAGVLEADGTFKQKTNANLNTAINTLILRMHTYTTDTLTYVFDKIVITEISDETRNYASATIITEDGDNVVTNLAKPGDLVVMPEVTEPEGKLFVGWYDKTYDFTGGSSKSEIAIPVSVLRVTSDMAFNSVTYVAKYIDKAAMEIDFSSQYYQGNDTSGTAWSEYPLNASGAVASNRDRAKYFRVLTDETTGESYARFDAGTADGNIFKMNLYTADSNILIAYEGVTYDISIDYNYISAGKDNGVSLGISRCAMWGFMPHALDGLYEQGTSEFANKNTTLNERRTQTQTHTVRNTYTAADGVTSGGTAQITNRFALYVYTGVAEIYSVTITPVSYTAPAFQNIDPEKGSIDVDYENGTVTVTPNEGYEVSAKGVTTVQTYRDYTIGKNNKNEDTCFADDFVKTALSNATTDGKVFKFDSNIDGVRLNSLRFEVDFVKAEDINAAYIAMSKRTPGMVNDKYQSAGIRFRLRVSASDANAASEIGFVFIPQKALDLEKVKTVEEYMTKRANGTLANADYSVSGVAKDNEKHIFYDDSVTDHLDYQVYLTNLTNQNYDDEKNEKMMALEVCVATYFVDAEGNTTYINLAETWSYNKVAGK